MWLVKIGILSSLKHPPYKFFVNCFINCIYCFYRYLDVLVFSGIVFSLFII
jgi:hypothetical protein